MTIKKINMIPEVKILINNRIKILNKLISQTKQDIQNCNIDLNRYKESELIYCTLLAHKSDLYLELSNYLAEIIKLNEEVIK
jgi:hypothetical protein